MKRIAMAVSVLVALANATPTIGSRLPRLEAGALDGSRLVLPDSMARKILLLGFGYKRESQDDLNSWLVPFRREYPTADGFRSYEVPMMGPRIPGLLRGVINRAMRNAIAKENRRWVAPYYGNIEEYSRRLGVTDRSQVQMFLLDRNGLVRWHAAGPAVGSALEELRIEVARLAAEGD
jgi:hypothetical protein